MISSRFFNRRVAVEPFVPGLDRDRFNQPIDGWGDPLPVDPGANVARAGTRGRTGATEVTVGQDTQVADWIVVLPPGQPAGHVPTGRDRIRLLDDPTTPRLEVVGPPQHVYSGGEQSIRCFARSVDARAAVEVSA